MDTGGTFTDLVALSDQGQLLLRKVSSTPRRPSDAVCSPPWSAPAWTSPATSTTSSSAPRSPPTRSSCAAAPPSSC
ncbi:hydantoinase/oxoprolinase N-terminal domain-containing protein [Streptosporangium vulgare]|uniref:hydantoinase/oxoprolinase N-terminal domain-containing protein n=1 Tax=Streptosporangium vulgare TaxID=46190 RepID=UPI003CD07D4C